MIDLPRSEPTSPTLHRGAQRCWGDHLLPTTPANSQERRRQRLLPVDVAARNSLEAFINQVRAQSGKKIDAADADALIAAAEEALGTLTP